MIIGITGTDGAGKGTVVSCLVDKHGFSHYSVRDTIVLEIERLGLPVDRNQMRLTGNALRAEFGNEAMVRKAYERAVSEGKDKIVIESVRVPDEVDFLKLHHGFLLAVDADVALRYSRVQERRSASDQVTFEQFKQQEAMEMNNPDPHGQQKAKVMAMADYTIINDSTLEELQAKVNAFLQKISG
jgi:dephospho-CoA kinase